MANHCYINSIAQISCQSPLSDEWFNEPILLTEDYVRSQEANAKGLISPSEARRMSRILKRAVITALTALEESGVHQLDAIITGTGMGCMENSEKFLMDICNYGENCLKPTLFMQSTHNTISSLIAIILKCNGYNNTYSHKGISFESALLDAWIQIKGGLIEKALVGAHDEVTPFMRNVMRSTHPEYSVVSETSVYSVLSSSKSETNISELSEVKLFHNPELKHISQVLALDDNGILMLGVNGNPLNDKPYTDLLSLLPDQPFKVQYKNIFGDNFSVSALSFYAAAKILENQRIPDFMSWNNQQVWEGKISEVTILNQCDNSTWALMKLKRVL
mgnify:FL=1